MVLYASETSLNPNGFPSSLWMSGCAVYAGVVIVANQTLWRRVNTHDGVIDFLIFGSVAAFFIAFAVLCHISPELIGIFSPTLGNPLVWLGIVGAVLTVWGVDLFRESLQREARELSEIDAAKKRKEFQMRQLDSDE